MKLSPTAIGYTAGLIASFFWGVHSVIIRHLTQEGVSPSLIAGSRLYVGVIVMFVMINVVKIFSGSKKKENTKFMTNSYFWIASISLGINFLLFQYGLEFTLASDANLIQNFSPVAVLIISSIFLSHRIKEIAPTHKNWVKILQIVLIGSVGASLVLINDVNNAIVPSRIKMFGDLIEFAAMLFFALFVMFSSEYAKTGLSSSLKTNMCMLTVAAVPVSLFVPFSEFALLSSQQWMWIIFIGAFPTGVAYWFWHVASKRLHVVPLALNLVYIGVITVFTEYLFLDLNLDWKIIVGATMMISASILAEITNSRVRKEEAKKLKVEQSLKTF